MQHSVRLSGESASRSQKNYDLPYLNPELPSEQRAEDLLSRMTIAEKIGEMTQLDITLINKTGKQRDIELDADKARELILKHHIGSFLNGEAAAPEVWFRFMDELTRIAVEESRLGIPLIFGIDHIHGASYLSGSTIFPQGINLGATFNPEHARHTGYTTALECADVGHHWCFSPVLDLGLHPQWPRFWETYGEDPHLAARMGEAFVRGMQENQETAPYKVAATGKHFLGYSDPRAGWDRTPAYIPMQQIHEFHRVSFQKAVDAGLRTIMLNSGEVNGVPVHASYELLTELLRNKMGFDGVVVTDWDDVRKLMNFHYTAADFTEATYQSVMAGIDMCMTPLTLDFNESMLELVESGRITEGRLDASVRRILKLKFDLGLFENPFPRNDRFARIGSTESKGKALKAAQESVILLKNKNETLPLKQPKRIGLFGPSAQSRRNLCGGWTLAWQGGEEARYPESMHTIHTALQKEFPSTEVVVFSDDALRDLQKASVRKQKSFLQELEALDALIYAGGEEPYCEFAGNISDLRLPKPQREDVQLLSRAKVPLLLVLVQGRPRLITELLEGTDAFIHAGLPGFEGAEAIAKVLSGAVNPSGRLPFSYPKWPNHFLPYHHKRSNIYFFDPSVANHITQGTKNTALYPFGFGLSYTTFAYSGLRLSRSETNGSDPIRATVRITNTGTRTGTETVLWFTSTLVGRITRPVKQLRHFEKVRLKPGESAECTYDILPVNLSYPDENAQPVLENGTYSVEINGLSAGFLIKQ
ncbi:MAG: glycoside hydrolase family 3 C-terminal domain-containing protein [Candidatus Cyclonatronum sp.]|uniref:glycoside hydrolase family 3 protein n=1 Tax=Cyclonatronum sp. TaxID=3024185 RepID=UPI0025BFE117|nr:glycoside hydrolase family 3 N-terminal domain-containing protein [Cyclonatronum sp.]MCH8487612.1 glycoside hydrolase family 3 C-terminal domain-containing protein [Cyclonatronum sp.]